MLDRLRTLTHTTFVAAAAGAVLLWAALPPVDWWPLAWIAPVAWLLLARRRQLPGRRPYVALWLVGFLFWLATYHFVRLPHPAAGIGWVALAAYLGVYLPALIALVRVAIHRLGWPLWLAAPIVWTGLDLARAHLLTGITMAALGHTQYRWIALIQTADLAGAYAVGLVMMVVAAVLAQMLPSDDAPWTWRPLPVAVAVLAAALGYGHWRLATAPPPGEAAARIALIQGSIDSEFKHDPELVEQIHRHYYELSLDALERFDAIDLIVWPETMFRDPLLSYDEGAAAPPEWTGTQKQFEAELPYFAERSQRGMTALAEQFGVPVLLGVDTVHCTPQGQRRYNSAVLVTPEGKLVDRYDKMHRVLFGEYVPFADWLPWLQRLTPLPSSLSPGRRPAAMEVAGVRLAPNICYESVLPHVIRSQVLGLRRQGAEPDVLVNLTNDGWFWGSSELDMHLVCGVFRAVECRKPMLIAANTGFSAWIDSDGRIRARGPRRAADVLLATVAREHRRSFYLDHGDWLPGVCLAVCVVLAVVGRRASRQPPRDAAEANQAANTLSRK